MNKYFVPKEFDAEKDYCSEYQNGENRTFPHWHSGAEIIYVNRGEVKVMFGDTWHTLTAGSLVFIPPGRLHNTSCLDPNAEKTVIGFSEKLFGTGRALLSLSSEVDSHCIFSSLEDTEISNLISKFHLACAENSSPEFDLAARSLIIDIYARIMKYWKKSGINALDEFAYPMGKSKNKLVSSVRKYVEEEFMNELSAAEAAKRFNVSYTTLAQAMRELDCGGFIKYVNRVRTENAKKLLATTDKSVTEIGLECGFSVTGYFIKIFRGFVGMTPKAYRRFVTSTKT
ncbi:MAG: AraC family transcriptional regulator [Clostridia bacterium]|nr:AraC family transcriptional regulator [Clostridia bacterium]